MPDLFSPFTLKDVTLRNRLVMSPMTMYRATNGKMSDFHLMLLGSRAAGGFGLVFPEQLAITSRLRSVTSLSVKGEKRSGMAVQPEGLSKAVAFRMAMSSPGLHQNLRMGFGAGQVLEGLPNLGQANPPGNQGPHIQPARGDVAKRGREFLRAIAQDKLHR